jgi:hypothetical protein
LLQVCSTLEVLLELRLVASRVAPAVGEPTNESGTNAILSNIRHANAVGKRDSRLQDFLHPSRFDASLVPLLAGPDLA